MRIEGKAYRCEDCGKYEPPGRIAATFKGWLLVRVSICHRCHGKAKHKALERAALTKPRPGKPRRAAFGR